MKPQKAAGKKIFVITILLMMFPLLSCSAKGPIEPKMPIVAPTSTTKVLVETTQKIAPSPTPQGKGYEQSKETRPTFALEDLVWDQKFEAPECNIQNTTPLMDEALALAGLTVDEVGFSNADIKENDFFLLGYYSDEFSLPAHKRLISEPLTAGCFEGETAGALDYYMTQDHPVASVIRHAADLLGRSVDNDPPVDADILKKNFDEMLETLCETTDGCGKAKGDIPPKLANALVPLIWALNEGIEARYAMDKELTGEHDAEWWYKYGGIYTMVSFSAFLNQESINLENESDRAYLAGELGRRRLYRAASQIAFAVEETDWSPFTGMLGVEYEIETGAGWIIVRDGANQDYKDEGKDILLFLDLGGNDRHEDAIGANTSGKNPVSVAIDLSGEEVYFYKPEPTKYDNQPGLPVSDADGRYKGDQAANESAAYGNISLSEVSRQGGARNGIAMLFDFGKGNDFYQSLRGSQGYAHLGVGVLFDDGGNDVYLGENSVQGSAQFGIGIAIDKGEGDDQRFSFVHSQGFGYVAGAGIVFDEGGNDLYSCDIGDPKYKGIPMYYSPQMPGEANASFCQGAGFGKRSADGANTSQFLSGGIGILRDKKGSDQYVAAVFAQGTGFWKGIGLFSDGGGEDTFNARWYVQGAAAHYAVGIFVDSGEGDDVFQGLYKVRAMGVGAGHDLSVGVFINEMGDDDYFVSPMSFGASNCNGIGIFIDNAGKDSYLEAPALSLGYGNVSDECIETRANGKSIGIMIDGGGDEDVYEHGVARNASKWSQKVHNLEAEYGVGIDGQGDSGIHAGSGSDP